MTPGEQIDKLRRELQDETEDNAVLRDEIDALTAALECAMSLLDPAQRAGVARAHACARDYE